MQRFWICDYQTIMIFSAFSLVTMSTMYKFFITFIFIDYIISRQAPEFRPVMRCRENIEEIRRVMRYSRAAPGVIIY